MQFELCLHVSYTVNVALFTFSGFLEGSNEA